VRFFYPAALNHPVYFGASADTYVSIDFLKLQTALLVHCQAGSEQGASVFNTLASSEFAGASAFFGGRVRVITAFAAPVCFSSSNCPLLLALPPPFR
jgi:hypothetical protein